MKIIVGLLFIFLSLSSIYSTAFADSVAVSSPRFPEQIQRQKLLDRQKVISLGQNDPTVSSADSLKVLMNIFYSDQFRKFSDPEAPYFMVMSKDTHLAMGVGGILLVRGWEDWNGVVEPYVFSPYNIPIPKNPARRQRLYATPANSGFFLTLLGRNTAVGDFMAHLEGAFNGYQRMGFKVRRAYIRLKGFTAGYALSTFLDAGAMPRMVDGGVYSGTVDRANILVRYQKDFKSGWSVAGGLEFPNTYIEDVSGSVEACSPYLPDLAAFGQYRWDEGFSHVRLSGLLRTLGYRDLLSQRNHNKLGWGLALSSTVKVIPDLSLYGAVVYGKGHLSYLSDMSNGAHDLVAVAGCPGVLQAPEAFSYFVGGKYNFRPELYSTVTFSQVRNYENLPADPEGYKYGLCGAANIFWEITPRLILGAEYMIGERMNFDGSHGSSNRAEAMFQLSF
ncbi:MAG: porin [Muribaculaceae bacterium]|nr:porin [Muribaculaceae bacterium]